MVYNNIFQSCKVFAGVRVSDTHHGSTPALYGLMCLWMDSVHWKVP